MKNGTIKNEIDRELAQMTFNQAMQKKFLVANVELSHKNYCVMLPSLLL